MGTRADFYVGRGTDAEWLGSVTWDGYPAGFDTQFWQDADTQDKYRANITTVSGERDDWTDASEGWPWPWQDSRTTDYTYAWDDGKVYFSIFGGPWLELTGDGSEFKNDEEQDEYYDLPKLGDSDFPNMKSRQMNLDDMMSRSGLIVISAKEQ